MVTAGSLMVLAWRLDAVAAIRGRCYLDVGFDTRAMGPAIARALR
jgi:hypothetical protein